MSDSKIPGGYFLNPDGKSAHDANGNPVPLFVEDTPLVWSIPTPDLPAPIIPPVEEVAVKSVEKKKAK
jgi:hypothetical protein